MAAAIPAAADGGSNFVRLTRLLISKGTKVVRELLDSFIPPANLTAKLMSPAVYTRLQQMKRTRLLTQPQWSLLFPSPGTCGNSTSFDITLLFKLLREFCGLTAPATGWDNLPNSTDLTLTADLARIKYYRNTLYGHVNEEMQLSDDEFKDYWKEIKDALLRIVAHYDPSKVPDWAIAINDLLTSPLTDDDRRNIEELKAWYLDEKQLKEIVEELSRQVQNLAQDGAQWETVAEANYPEIGVCQELVACVGVQDLRTICPTKAAKKVAGILQLDKSSFKDPPADVRQKCRAFCMHLKKEGRPDIIRELRTKLPSGMTGL